MIQLISVHLLLMVSSMIQSMQNAKIGERESRHPCPTLVLYFNSSLRFVPQMSLSETGHKMHYTFSRVSQFSIDIRKTTVQKESRASPKMLYGYCLS